MKKILWISPYAPYDKIPHAGGKNHNYYIKYFKKNSNFDITLLSLCYKKAEKELKFDNIKNEIYIMKDDFLNTIIRYIVNIDSEYNPFNKYAGAASTYQTKKLIKLITQYSKKNINPDIIIMQWTQVILLIPIIKKIFSKSKFVAIEEDVSFLSYYRKMKYSNNFIMKKVAGFKYKKLYELELKMLNQSNLVVLNNGKDADLLRKSNFDENKLFTSSVYFDNYSCLKRNAKKRDIIFFGAMGRKENYLSAIWFIRNVFPLLEDMEVQFVIIGGGVNRKLKKYQSSKVKIVGYVDDLSKYFSECLCLVAPLVLGAGIKVKVLEALSAGIPVLTNDIGIEGIGAKDGTDYFHCNAPKQYADIIKELIDKSIDAKEISNNARNFIQHNFDLDKKLNQLIEKINLLCNC